MHSRKSDQLRIQALDLFCGAGGLSYGLQEAGIPVSAGLDFDQKCEFPFTHNVGGHFLAKDLAETDSAELAKHFDMPRYSLIAGCAPCQPFSTLSNGSDRKKSNKWPLLRQFGRVVGDLRPTLVTMENVPVIKREEVFDEFVAGLKDLGYHVTFKTIDASEYGVPQRRKRLVLLASLLGPVRILSAEELGLSRATVRDAISHLPKIQEGEADSADPLHKARSLTSINLKRIRSSKPGGTWEDWPSDLVLACHRKANGATFKSVYGRLEWDKPSSTMTTQAYNFGTGRYGHPEQDRSLSLREMAILQSFPDDYQFVSPGEKIEFASVGRMIGNAVPVRLGYVIGCSIQHHIDSIESYPLAH